MIVGIVGHEATKFTPAGRRYALEAIEQILMKPEVTGVTSGHCHLGGIDMWAENMVVDKPLDYFIYPPKRLSWEGGYKQRNLQIATKADHVVCIVVNKLPPDYKGMKFNHCYHCGTADHVKSGGCWTAKQAVKLGKSAEWIIIPNPDFWIPNGN